MPRISPAQSMLNSQSIKDALQPFVEKEADFRLEPLGDADADNFSFLASSSVPA